MDFTTSTAPWFFSIGLAGAFTLLGGLISWFSVRSSDKRKFAHEDRMRWADKIRELCSMLIANDWEISTFRIERIGRELADVRGEIGANLELIYKDPQNKELRAKDAELRAKEAEAIKDDVLVRGKQNANLRIISDLRLLAPPDVVAAAEYFAKVGRDSDDEPTYLDRITVLSKALHKQLGV